MSITEELKNRIYFPIKPPSLQRTYAPTEHAERHLYVYGLALDPRQKIIQEAKNGEVVMFGCDLWCKTSDYETEMVSTFTALGTALHNIKDNMQRVKDIDTVLESGEVAKRIAYGVEFQDGYSVIITEGPLDDQYFVWMPKMEVTEADDKLITRFQRAWEGKDFELAKLRLDEALEKFARLSVISKEDEQVQIIGIHGVRVVE